MSNIEYLHARRSRSLGGRSERLVLRLRCEPAAGLAESIQMTVAAGLPAPLEISEAPTKRLSIDGLPSS